MFLIIIFIPNIGLFQHTDENKIKDTLNRDAYKFPNVKISQLGLADFSAIEKWYADKIILITKLSQIWSMLNYTFGISTKPGQAIVGKNDWLFLGNDYASTIDQYTGKNIANSEEILLMVKSFKQINDVAKEYKVPFLLVVPPDKNDIYPEYLPNYIGKRSNRTRLDILDIMMPKYGVNFIDLRGSEFVTKNTFGKKYGAIYLAGDSHWNYLGAYGAYNAISEYANQFFKLENLNHNKISFTPESTTNTDLTRFLQIKGLTSNSPTPNLSNLTVNLYGKSIDGRIDKMSPYQGNDNDIIIKDPYENINTALINKPNALLISDSFSNYLGFYFHNDFYDTVRISNGNRNYNLSDLIEKYHPKIIVLQIVERSLMNYSNNFNPFITKYSISTPNSTDIHANIDLLVFDKGVINCQGWGYIPNKDAFLGKTYLRLSNINNHINFDFLLNTNLRDDIKTGFNDGVNLALSGFNGKIKESDLPHGTYKASIIIINDNSSSIKSFDIKYQL